ncbi:MAG: hypothetical protein JNM81_08155 [Rhodospirillaceae bacterium]|nr:hypothetical protein [Rhodospirillaceae bacterium]
MAFLQFTQLACVSALSVMLTTWAATSAIAETIKVGLVDFALRHDALKRFDRVKVRSITFETSEMTAARYQSSKNAKGHADVMAAELVESFQGAAPGVFLELYVASPFLEDPNTGRQSIDFEQLEFAYDWFARQGVKIVAQTFVSRDNENLERAIATASKEGLVLLTSAGNGPRQNVVPPFPASYNDAIGISTTGLSDELNTEERRNDYVRYSVPAPAASPIKLRQDPEAAVLAGSSRATVTAAGLLGALSTRYRLDNRADAVLVLDALAEPVAEYGHSAYGIGVLMQDNVATHLKSGATHPRLRRLLRDDRLSA